MSQVQQHVYVPQQVQYSQEYGTYMQQQQHQQQQLVPPRPTHKTTSIKSKDWTELQPDASFVTPEVASSTMKQFLANTIADEGFEKAEPTALYRFELEVVAFVEQIFLRAKQFADNSDRERPTATDLLEACEEYDLDIKELRKDSRKWRRRKRKRAGSKGPELILSSRRSASPELLPSDDEDSSSLVPQTLRTVPSHLPPLPPKHTYLRTPAPPPKKQALPSLEKKLENAALVQESLRNLLLSTEVDTDTNDGELFGGVINWEATKQPRKKWKIGR